MGKMIGVLLGAGKSSRMGKNKLAMKLKHGPVGHYALRSALMSNLDHIIFVGSDVILPSWVSGDLKNAFLQSLWSYHYSPESCVGMSHSLREGVRFAEALEATAMMVILADQPFQSAMLLNRMIITFNKRLPPFLGTSIHSATIPPVIISGKLFSELHKLQGDHGARFLLEKYKDSYSIMEVHDPFYNFDIDTRDDFEMAGRIEAAMEKENSKKRGADGLEHLGEERRSKGGI
ncbi:NTP transferase domain-containing protein [Falsibacillus albus]|nr:NTP transferase domain-containing protein [Falsibacillus albus]